MKKRMAIAGIVLLAALFGGCGNQRSTQEQNAETPSEPEIETTSEVSVSSDAAELLDGIYTAEFKTDSGMFHVSEACDGKGTLTVENGKMTIHISLASKNIVNLYPGLAKDAAKEGAELLTPTEDTVTYKDGMTEEVYGFDVPVPALETEFELALIGTKGKWYDHKVSVSNPVPAEGDAESKNVAPLEEDTQSQSAAPPEEDTQGKVSEPLEDGVYRVELTFEGGSGRAEILSPATVTVTDGKTLATVEWSSPNYDYMLVGKEKYLPVNTEGGAVFEFPIPGLDEPINVIGDTVAMSKPHEVEYTLTFHSETMKKEERNTEIR